MRLLIIFSLVFGNSFAQASDPKNITINPDSLRERLLDGNIPILIAINNVAKAKDRVNIARGNLLPSINVAGVLATFANPMFALGMIQFLVPFLVPSNWFDFFQSKDLLNAEKQSYHALQLNTYASALALYQLSLSDQQIYQVIEQEYKDLKEIYDILSQRDEVLGNVSQNDLLLAKVQFEQAASRLAKMNELLIDENSQMRQALALPLETEISYSPNQIAPSTWEDKPISEAVDQALAIAPESQQLKDLLAAAKGGKWSKVFAFISGATVGAQGFFSNTFKQPVSFSNMVATVNVNFGFAYYPAIALSQKNVNEVMLRQQELRVDNTQILEKVILSLKKAKEDFEMSSLAEKHSFEVYKSALIRMEMGMETLVNVLLFRKQASELSVSRIQANNLLNQFRITLDRTLLEDQFSKIKGCNLNPDAAKKPGWLKRVFGGGTSLAVDQACHGATGEKK